MKLNLSKCNHPAGFRWQWKEYWECGICMKQFWGTKDSTPDPIHQFIDWEEAYRKAGILGDEGFLARA